MTRPFSQACENNREAIFAVLERVFADRKQILEIGSGTGQHAAAFAPHLPHLVWQTSDLPEHHPGIEQWIKTAPTQNLLSPVALNVNDKPWPIAPVDGIFSANTFHIMSWPSVQNFFSSLALALSADGMLAIYGPFNYDGTYTSPSNARFDQWLKDRDPAQGIRDFEAVNALALELDLILIEDKAMPANNRLLVWKRGTY